MSSLIIFDTDVLIDVALEIDEAVNCLREAEQESGLAISVVTQMELLVGCRSKTELRKTERFLQRFQLLRLSESVSDLAVNLLRQYRLSHGLLIPDALIAATAIALNLPLVSKNQRDFRFIEGLKLLPYPRQSASV